MLTKFCLNPFRLAINLDILNTLIKNQRTAIRYQQIFACIVLLSGLLIIIFSNLAPHQTAQNETLKLTFGIGGGFISTISAYPINQIINRKERIKTYELLKVKMHEMSDMEINKVEALIWTSLEKIM